MKGNLDILAEPDSRGLTCLRRQHFCAPMHLSKPYLEEGTLLVNAVNPTAGLFSGDSVRCRVEVESGARMLLTSPSASRVHRAGEGFATLSQHFTVRNNGFLEVFPETLIPQRGARYSQQTRVEVEERGVILHIESIAPGRVASGEVFQFESIRWATDVIFNDRLILRERSVFSADAPQLRMLRRKFSILYFANVVSVGLDQPEELVGKIQSDLYEERSAWVGGGRLVFGGFFFRIISCSAIDLRRCIMKIRELIYKGHDRKPPSLRRL